MTNVVIMAATQVERIGLNTLLQESEQLTVLATLSDLQSLDELPPETDILLVTSDILPRVLSSCPQEENAPGPALLLLSDESEAIDLLTRFTVWGVLPRDNSQEELQAAIQALSQGLVVIPPYLLTQLRSLKPKQNTVNELIEKLTPRENEVLQLLAQGMANKQIAFELGVSEHTVKFHITSIYTKLGANNRAEVIRRGFEYGLIVL